jgi:DNA modification methylase
MKTNYIIVGDALKELKALPTESVHLICTDPPYNLGKDYGNNIDLKEWREYERFTMDWLIEANRVLKRNGSIYVFMGVRFISKLFGMLEELGLFFNGWITWHYTQGMGRKQGYSPRHEDILFFTKSDNFTFNLDDIRVPQKYFRKRNNMQGANPGDVWQFSHVHYSNPERVNHPTQKPEALIKRIILASSNEGDLILDPFVGSGTTCIVSDHFKRKWIGIDLNPNYVEMARERISRKLIEFDSFDPREKRVPLDLHDNYQEDNSLFSLNCK